MLLMLQVAAGFCGFLQHFYLILLQHLNYFILFHMCGQLKGDETTRKYL